MEGSLTIGFIGLGLIGGSIAKSIKRFHPQTRILAYTRTEATLDQAVSQGIVDVKCQKEDEAFASCDYIFLCAPVNDNISYLHWLKDHIKPECVITDVGSVKGEIHQAVHTLGLDAHFIGGHPMAGSEKTGFENATDLLIENAYYILTPGGEIDILRLTNFMELITSLGAIPLVLTYEEHDYITAAVSHLPHIIASTLVNAVQKMDTPEENMKLIAAGGFKDITRIASSSPVMWQQICMENRPMISRVLDEYIRLIVQAKCWIDNGDSQELYQMFSNSRDYRNALPEATRGALEKAYVFYCDIYDEAGGIATIATLLAMNNISIKNIGIVHNREFEEGVLRIEFYDDESCKKAQAVLTERNYTLHIR